METRVLLLKKLNTTVSQVLDIYQTMKDPEIIVYEDWSAKDVLGHITFWHESFARNVRDLVNGVKPTPLKGKYSELNELCLSETRNQTVKTITIRLAAAHGLIQENILSKKLQLIPYKKGARSYTPEEHLEITANHIDGHLRDLKKAGRDL